jgi:hypothetical protein
MQEYTKNVYAIILAFFENLKHLTIVVSCIDNYPGSIHSYPCLSLYNLPPMTFSSSTLTKLCINVNCFDDVCDLLDGRLKQLTTFIVQVKLITNRVPKSYNRVSL